MEIRLVLKNAVSLGTASILSKAITAIVGIVVTRYLGPGPFGEYSAAYAFVGTFVLFTDFGVSQYMVQEGSRDENVLPVFLGNILTFKTITSLLAYFAMLILMFPAGYNLNIRTMVEILGITVGLGALNASVYNYFQAKQQMYLAAGFQFLSTFMIGLLTMVVVISGGNVVMITVTHLGTTAFISALLYLTIRRRMKLKVNFKQFPALLKGGIAFGTAYIFYNIYFQIDSLMLSIMRTPRELGMYSAAYKLVAIFLFIPSILTSVIYPVLYQLGVTDKSQHKHTIEKIFKVLSGVGIPASILLFVLAKPIINWLYAGRFPESGPILMILCWFFALECLSFSLGDVLTTTDHQWYRTRIQGIAALGNVVLNLFLIPRLGIYGAAIATLVTEIYILVAYYVMVRKKVYQIHILRQLPVVVSASIIMGIIAYLTRNIHPVESALLAGVVYLVILISMDRDFRKIGNYAWRQGLRLVRIKE